MNEADMPGPAMLNAMRNAQRAAAVFWRVSYAMATAFGAEGAVLTIRLNPILVFRGVMRMKDCQSTSPRR
jgi:hypothetical protein